MNIRDATDEKLKDKRKELIHKMEAILDRDNLSESDKKTCNSYKENIENINQELKNRNINMDNLETVYEGDATERQETSKLYNATENIYQPKKDDIKAESFLRAVMDKPQSEKEREAVQNSVTSDGYTLPDPVASQIVDKLRASNPVIQAGARSVEIESGKTNYVKIDEYPQATFHDELNEESLSSGSFSSIKMEAKTVMSVLEVSRELLQDSNNASTALTMAMTNSLNDAIITSTFNGSASNELKGMATQVSQTETYSGSVSYDELIKGGTQLYNANVSEDNRSIIHAPDMAESLALQKDSNNQYIKKPESLSDYQQFTNSNVPTGISYMGDFTNALYGYTMDISLEQFNSASARKFGTTWLCVARLDYMLLQPKSFVRIESA